MPDKTSSARDISKAGVPPRRAFASVAAFVVVALLLCAGAAVLYGHNKPDLASILGYGVLPATQSLLSGHGLTICSSELAKTPGNPLCFHSARMPMAEWVVALAIKTVGGRVWRVMLFKIVLLLLPLGLTIYFVSIACFRGNQNLLMSGALLLSPFFMVPFLMDVVRVDYEEAYSYGLIALAFALVLFTSYKSASLAQRVYLRSGIGGCCAALVYLSKSSMILFAGLFAAIYFCKLSKPGARLLLLILFLSAPGGWALYQHHVSGRYSLGTSLDGFNLHMGNSEHFLRDYPPPAGRTLDDTAEELNAGVYFGDEWSLNDYHQRAARLFTTNHRGQALRGLLRKLLTIFLSVNEVGTYKDHGLFASLTKAGIVLFRLMFSSALLVSLFCIFTNRPDLRGPAAIYLLLVGAIILPYALGFAYTRHLSVLMYPTAILWCRVLCASARPGDERVS